MKKVLGFMSKLVASVFSIAVLALLMSLTYGALQRIFPGNFANQMWGLVMFDIAAMCWALMFVFQSHSVGQYGAAGVGFLVGFLGTLGMVAAEVILSGNLITNVNTEQIGRWMTYGFIIVTALHAALVYIHHGTSPEIAEQINVGVARGEVVSQAIANATKTIEAEKQELSQAIYNDIVSQVKRDLGMHPIQDTVFDRHRYPSELPYPVTWAKEDATAADNRPLSSRFRDWVSNLRKTPTPPTLQQIAQTSDALMAWQETPSGRRRLWCKVCRDANQDWLSDQPCQHISEAEPGEKIDAEVAMATLRELMREQPASQPSQ